MIPTQPPRRCNQELPPSALLARGRLRRTPRQRRQACGPHSARSPRRRVEATRPRRSHVTCELEPETEPAACPGRDPDRSRAGVFGDKTRCTGPSPTLRHLGANGGPHGQESCAPVRADRPVRRRSAEARRVEPRQHAGGAGEDLQQRRAGNGQEAACPATAIPSGSTCRTIGGWTWTLRGSPWTR